jgi:polyisoprenoid-binding protein YceI
MNEGDMQKKTKIGLWITGGVVVLGGAALAFGPAVYADYANSNAEAAPTIAPATTSPTGSATSAAVNPDDLSGTWSIGADSYAGYRVDEVLQGNDVTVTGRTADVTGDLTVDSLSLTAATITVDVASIATDEGARDAYFRDTAMEVGDFPTATFTLTEPVTLEAPVAGVAQTLPRCRPRSPMPAARLSAASRSPSATTASTPRTSASCRSRMPAPSSSRSTSRRISPAA